MLLEEPRRDLATSTLTAVLKSGTRDLHRAAERAGLMHGLLHGRVGRAGYCLLLRNLHVLYRSLEDHLDRHATQSLGATIAFAELRRADALASDLDVLHGPRWRDELAPGLAMQHYVARLDAIARAEPALLASHAYVRYLGDLSGGQLLRRVIAAALGINGDAGLAFYRFTDDPAALAARLRNGLDAMAPAKHLTARLVDEARWAFRRHIDLFEELAAAVRPADAAPLR